MKNDPVEFYFRVWTYSTGDPPDIEVWYHGLEETGLDRQVSEWVAEAMVYEDFTNLFDLDKTKSWQIVGSARLLGKFDYWGEYDEILDILKFEKSEVPEDFHANTHEL